MYLFLCRRQLVSSHVLHFPQFVLAPLPGYSTAYIKLSCCLPLGDVSHISVFVFLFPVTGSLHSCSFTFSYTDATNQTVISSDCRTTWQFEHIKCLIHIFMLHFKKSFSKSRWEIILLWNKTWFLHYFLFPDIQFFATYFLDCQNPLKLHFLPVFWNLNKIYLNIYIFVLNMWGISIGFFNLGFDLLVFRENFKRFLIMSTSYFSPSSVQNIWF